MRGSVALRLNMACALCHQNKPLRQSHIVPEFMYKPMYDPLHRFEGLSLDVSEPPQIHQKGLREELLCQDCEQRFSRFEHHAAERFYRPAIAAMRQLPPGFTLTNMD